MPIPTVQPLHTPRLTLRPFTTEDRKALSALHGDPQVMRFYGNGEALDDAQINLVLDAHVHCRYRAYWAWSVTLNGDDKGECFGQVTAGPVEWNGEQWIELCWLLTPKNWRKGFGTEAVKAVIEHGLSDLGWQKVMAGSDIRNEASLRMMSKCGMAYTREELDSHKRMRRIHTLTRVPGQSPVTAASHQPATVRS